MSNTNTSEASRGPVAARILRALSLLQYSETTELGSPDDPRSARARVKQLCYSHLQRGYETGRAGLRAHIAVLETLAKEYRSCPVLLCWRVWEENQSRTLAPDHVRRPPVQFGTTSHLAMAARLLSYRASKQGVCQLRGAVLAKNWRQRG